MLRKYYNLRKEARSNEPPDSLMRKFYFFVLILGGGRSKHIVAEWPGEDPGSTKADSFFIFPAEGSHSVGSVPIQFGNTYSSGSR